jgi:uroporphyrinogen decarboxylase
MRKMTRRERILTTIAHKEPDRVPIGFDIYSPVKEEILKHYGVKDLQSLYEKTEIDCFSVWDWPSVLPKYKGQDREGIEQMDSTYGFWGKVGEKIYPLANETLENYRWPKADEFDYSCLNKGLDEIKDMDMTTASGHAGIGWLHHVQMRSYDNALYDVFDEAWMDEYLNRNREFILPYFENIFKHAKGKIDIIRADEDLGGHQNMLINPKLWRKWYKPLWKEIFDLCHSKGAKIWMHSCGFCRDVVPDFIEIGVDILNPIPPYVRGSDPEDMKKNFGKFLTFDGGVDQMNILTQGTPQMVREEVKLRLKQLAPGGGYIIGPSQVISRNVPAENVIAFFDTALEYGCY